jgi:hypothetical protein
MNQFIDSDYWKKTLTKHDWYLILADDFKRLEQVSEQQKKEPDYKRIKREAYQLVEDAVQNGTLPMSSKGPDLDSERKTIDTIVIHHTKNPPGMTLERLNAIQLLRIYGRYYANPTDEREKNFKGKPVWSGHFYNDQQVFWGYHWLIREDGSTEHILNDNYIGWHAGNWDINTRSIGICVDDSLTNKEPSDTVIKSLAELIKSNYANITSENIVGHCDVNKKTECPGHLFHESWQHKLKKLIYT